MNNVLVSIIVPVYNAENYITNCLRSIVDQTYIYIEVLVIDDGSTDRSGKICDEFARIDQRVHVFHHENHGVSYSRNYGIKHAKGEYITFVDSDDTLSITFIENLVKIGNGQDLIISASYDVWGGDEEKRIVERTPRTALKGILSMDFYALEPLLGVVWGKLYKTKIIKDNKLLFCEEFSLGEDQIFNFIYYEYVKSYSYAKTAKYYYTRRSNSLRSFVEKLDDEALIKTRLGTLRSLLDKINAVKKNIILCNMCIAQWMYAGSGYHKFKKRCQIIRTFINGRYASEGLKRWLVLKCIKYQIYPLIYFYYRIKCLLHKQRI